MNKELLARTLAEQAERAARSFARIALSQGSPPVEEGTPSEPSPESSFMEEGALSQAPEGTSSEVASPVSEASAAEPSSYTEGSLSGLTKLQIVELLLARQGTPSDEIEAETTRLMRLTKSDLISRCLAPEP
jgi:hypothetical protein